MNKLIPCKLNKGDTIGVIAPSDPIIGDKIDEIIKAKEIVEKDGFNVKFSKNLFKNTNGYSATVIEKAQDINEMFKDKNVKMIWCAKGGNNSNSVFDYIDYDLIKRNPKIICGYSDITSLVNIINSKTGLVTFSGTNFKTISTDKTDFSYKEAINRFINESLEFGMKKDDKYITLKSGKGEGELIGGNLFLTRGIATGKYSVNFENKILFIEELGFESPPQVVSNCLYFLEQNGVFEKIKGLWIGNYESEYGISLEKIVKDVIGSKYEFPIIKSNNFGHIETKTVIPIGVKAKIDTSKKIKIELLEKCVK